MSRRLRDGWPETYTRLSTRDPANLTPDQLENLADSAWLVCRLDESLGARQLAYARYQEIHDDRAAVRTAWRMFWDHLYNGDSVVALGWLRRANRHMAAIPESAECGFVALAESELALNRGAANEADAYATRAVDIGERHGSPSLIAFGLTLRGRALIAQGKLEEGSAALDEAMALVLTGRLDVFFTGAVYCTVIAECRDVADMQRASEWTDAARAWCVSLPVVTPFHGICRIHRGEILGQRGFWNEAENEIRSAAEELAAFKPRSAAEALYALAEIQRRRGDLAAAEHSYLQAHELGRDPQPGLALVRLAQGRATVASAGLRTALADRSMSRVRRAQLLAAQVSVALAVGDQEHAREAAQELSSIAELLGRPAVVGMAAVARGEVRLAGDDAGGAVGDLRVALATWRDLQLPYEEAQAHLLIGKAAQAMGDEEGARLEIQIARAGFERLGARRDAHQAAAATPGRADRIAGLTAREAEVLRLVAAGMSNRQIGQALAISEYTVARHLQNMFVKLGVSSRAAATAIAVAQQLV
ncbi:MAG TPA: LuxR C-terminal-related transcriptional regulator [Propionibacteriaceae bacterium]|nr:LuxR C-terminal-related transcriptional regulator [Propionibacteriaceae bacterium]